MVVDNKIQAENPKTIPAQPGAATYIKYTPAQQGAQVQPLLRQQQCLIRHQCAVLHLCLLLCRHMQSSHA